METKHTERTACPGSGTRWIGGTGSPICRVCHRGWRTLGVAKRPRFGFDASRRGAHFIGTVPSHDRLTSTPKSPYQQESADMEALHDEMMKSK